MVGKNVKCEKLQLHFKITFCGGRGDAYLVLESTLSPVFGKVLTNLLRYRMYTFLLLNEYIIETDLQKGFWSELSETAEYTELLSHLVKQLVIIFLYLKNAFGGVHHELIKKI